MNKNNSNKKPAICCGCKKEMCSLLFLSPVIKDELWVQCLSYYGLSKNKRQTDFPTRTPQFLCVECMETALGRKLTKTDLKEVSFNVYFILHYFHNVPLDTMVNIRRHAKKYITEAIQSQNPAVQTEVDFVNGVTMPFLHSDLAGYAKSLLTLLSDDELTEELKRRDKKRQAQYPCGAHCRDCKHCGEGRTFKHNLWTTTVCFAKPKPQMGPECYYATSLSCKICDKFEPK